MWDISKKYWFKGTLELKTALHIGGGKVNVTNTDSPIVRTLEGSPFIPGSSFKGAFRSTVEKLVASIPGLNSCQLIEGANGCPTARQEKFSKRKQNMSEDELVAVLERELCDTCKLFGSPFSASKIFFQDLMITNWPGVTQVRDGVVIDRDSERAKDGLKYDFEVVSPTSTFDLEIWLEIPRRFQITKKSLEKLQAKTLPVEVTNAVKQIQDCIFVSGKHLLKAILKAITNQENKKQVEEHYDVILEHAENPYQIDLGLVCVGLNEFCGGMVPLGGIKSRGLGHCQITKPEIYVLDLEEKGKKGERLKKYLLGTKPQDKMDKITELDRFIGTAITSLFNQTTSSRRGA